MAISTLPQRIVVHPDSAPGRPAAVAPRGHIPALDGLRGLAILLVMVYHFLAFVAPMPAGDPLARGLMAARDLGWTGVDLFFVLSGFLITGILADAKPGEPRGARGAKHYFAAFYMRRALRIFPLYYLYLFGRFVVLPASGRPHSVRPLAVAPLDQLWAWLYLVDAQVIAWGAFRPVPWATIHLWSLAVEEQFYFVWPAVVFLVAVPRLRRVCAWMIVGAILFRAVAGFALHSWGPTYFLPFARMDAFAIGALVALAARAPGGLARWEPAAGRALAVAGAAFAALYVASGGLERASLPLQIVGYTVIGGFFGALLVYVLVREDSRATRAFRHPVLRFFGRYSYALYMFHIAIAEVFASAVFKRYMPLGRLFGGPVRGGLLLGTRLPMIVLFLLVLTALSAGVALLSWYGFEKHLLKLKDRFPYAREGGRAHAAGLTPLAAAAVLGVLGAAGTPGDGAFGGVRAGPASGDGHEPPAVAHKA